MKKYLGVKIVDGEPMTLGEYNKFRGWRIPESEDPKKEGYRVVYKDGYVSWSPKEQFEEANRTIDNLTFGLAIEALKKGFKVARAGWNGKGMYLGLCEGGGFRDGFRTQDFIYMKTVNDTVVPWLASQTDMLTEDWQIVE
jgi:Protein of unknown function (DUF2829)